MNKPTEMERELDEIITLLTERCGPDIGILAQKMRNTIGGKIDIKIGRRQAAANWGMVRLDITVDPTDRANKLRIVKDNGICYPGDF
jgi:hypothetical protein